MNKILKAFIVIMPWPIKRFLLQKIYNYDLAPTSRVGLSWFFPHRLTMKPHATVGHFNSAVHLDEVFMDEYSSLGRNNWITGFPSGTESLHFRHQKDRKSILRIGKHSAITKNHHLDCTHLLSIGNFVTVAGYHSQFLTHSINIFDNRQDSAPIHIGDYTFVGTNSVILGGARLPDFSVLGAKSLLNKQFIEGYKLYGGVPAKLIVDLPEDAAYFTRAEGFVI